MNYEFEVGEIAKLKEGRPAAGLECEIMACGGERDYEIIIPLWGGSQKIWPCWEDVLIKKKPPSEDAAFTRFKKTLKQLETVS